LIDQKMKFTLLRQPKSRWVWPASRRLRNWSPGRCWGDQFRQSTDQLPQMASSAHSFPTFSHVSQAIFCRG